MYGWCVRVYDTGSSSIAPRVQVYFVYVCGHSLQEMNPDNRMDEHVN